MSPIVTKPWDSSPRFQVDMKPEKRGRGIAFKDYFQRNSAGMVPDRGFTKQLKALDPELEVVWDWINEIWAIWAFPKALGKEPYHVLNVCTKGKNYRELGQDILLKLMEMQKDRYETDKIMAYLDEHNRQVQRRKMKDFRRKIDSITRDTFNYARGVLQVQVPRSAVIGEVLR